MLPLQIGQLGHTQAGVEQRPHGEALGVRRASVGQKGRLVLGKGFASVPVGHTASRRAPRPDGTAFTTFLGTLNNGTSLDGTTISGCFAGHCDWRLPTSAELQTILLDPFPCGTSPCIDPIFGPTQSFGYWSATTFAGGPSDAWFVGFFDGNVFFGNKTFSNYVRAVRGGL